MSNCSCDWGDAESASFSKKISIKAARKSHRCCECGREIKIGKPYRIIKGQLEGEFYAFHQCQPCAKVYDDLRSAGSCVCIGELWEYIDQNSEQAEG